VSSSFYYRPSTSHVTCACIRVQPNRFGLDVFYLQSSFAYDLCHNIDPVGVERTCWAYSWAYMPIVQTFDDIAAGGLFVERRFHIPVNILASHDVPPSFAEFPVTRFLFHIPSHPSGVTFVVQCSGCWLLHDHCQTARPLSQSDKQHASWQTRRIRSSLGGSCGAGASECAKDDSLRSGSALLRATAVLHFCFGSIRFGPRYAQPRFNSVGSAALNPRPDSSGRLVFRPAQARPPESQGSRSTDCRLIRQRVHRQGARSVERHWPEPAAPVGPPCISSCSGTRAAVAYRSRC
jgi:hypothetical protein